MADPTAELRPRPHEEVRDGTWRTTLDDPRHLQEPGRPQAAAPPVLARPSCSASRSSPARFVLTDSLGKVFDDLFSTVSQNVAVDVRGDEVTSGDQGDVRALLAAGPRSTPSSSVDGVKEARARSRASAQLVDQTARPSAPAAPRRSASTGTTPSCCRAARSSRARPRAAPTRSPSTEGCSTAPTTRSATRRRCSPTSR